jgi:hypothetical protein
MASRRTSGMLQDFIGTADLELAEGFKPQNVTVGFVRLETLTSANDSVLPGRNPRLDSSLCCLLLETQ